MTTLDDQARTRQDRELVATASRVLAAQGLDDFIWGHASLRDRNGRGAWIKSAKWGLSEVTADRVHLVTAQGVVAAGEGLRHKEFPIHTEIYAARPDVGAVVHTHSPHSIALAATGEALRPVSHAATMFGAVPRFTATADLIVSPELGKNVAAELGSSEVMFLVNHGIVAVGDDLPTAVVRAVLLERACQQQMLTHAFGGWPSWSDAQESAAKRSNIFSQEALHAVWEHLVRLLPPEMPNQGQDDNP